MCFVVKAEKVVLIMEHKEINRKTHVCLIGGAFNPIHISHIKLAEFVLKIAKMDEVWFVPCNSHLEKETVSANHRVKMIELSAEQTPQIKVFDYEIKHQLHGESFHFLNRLIHDDKYENYRFFFCVGQDRADTIHEWYNSEELIKLGVGFICVPRKGYERDIKVDWYLKKPHIYIEDDGTIDIPDHSSTKVRLLMKEYYNQKNNFSEEHLNQMLNKNVLEYIKTNRLYLN